ncbi:hypothetical protein ACSQ67_024919 [Phaseolus vulgaris]
MLTLIHELGSTIPTLMHGRVTMDRRQPTLRAGLVGNVKANGHMELNMANINMENEDVEWLRNSFIGKPVRRGDGAGGKGELLHGRCRLHPSEISRRPVCALVGESDGIVQKTLKDNKEMMREDYLLACGTRGCFERVAAHVESSVEVDGATSEFEDLEFARLRVRAPMGRDMRMVMVMKINNILCRIVLEEETPSFNTCRCCSHGERGEARGGDSDEGSEEKFGEELIESEGSDADVQQYEEGKATKNARAVTRLPFLEEHVGCSWKASADGAHSKHAPVRKEDGTSKGLPTDSRSGNTFDLIVNGPAKAQLHEGSEFSIFVGLGSKQLEDERTGGVPIATSTKLAIDGARGGSG